VHQVRESCRSIAILVFILCSGTAVSQSELPDKPLIQYVTIDTVSGKTIIHWEPGETPNIRSYKIERLDITTNPVTGYPLDSVPGGTHTFSYDPCDSRYIDTINFPGPCNQANYIYTVTAVDQSGNVSLLSGDYHQPMHLKIEYDSCSSAMNLNWNKYAGWKNNLTGFYVYAKGESGDFQQLVRLDTNTVSFVHEGIDENSYYHYVVEAYDNQGHTSTSNIQSYFTYMPPPPDFINLNYVSVVDERTVEISFSADITGEINDFLVSRASSPEGNYTPIQTLLNVTEPTVQITDSIVTRAERFYYKVEALNSCFKPVASSNLGNNILVRGSAAGSVVELNWNPYVDFTYGVSEYAIYRKNSFDDYKMVDSVPPGTTKFTEDVRYLGASEISGELSYYIVAHENGINQMGIAGTSKSNKTVVNVKSELWLPNAFTPDGNGQNDYFGPIMDFIPKEYKMLIFDRTGKVLFQTTDPNGNKGKWDGTLNGSGKAREGVYVYHITYLSFTGQRKDTTGHVTLVDPKRY
jgi:gliding motility-associated-like protein